jgi:O-antigen ligase
VTIAGITTMMMLMKAWDETLGPFARRDGLTGRVQIWPSMVGYATDHPITGAGYGSFWNIGPSSPVYQYGRNWVAELSNGHNGYLDLLVGIGLPGLILVVAATMIIPVFKLLANTSLARERGALLIALLVFCAGHNMTETSLFERDTIIQVFLMLAVALTTVVTRRSGNSAPAGTTSKRRKTSAAHA